MLIIFMDRRVVHQKQHQQLLLSKFSAQTGRTHVMLQSENAPLDQTGMKEFAELADQYYWFKPLKLLKNGTVGKIWNATSYSCGISIFELQKAVVIIVLMHNVDNVRGQSSSPQINTNSISKLPAQTGKTPVILQTKIAPMNQTGMKEFAELFDQYYWSKRLKLLKDGNCRKNMESYITQLRNGSFWASKMYDASGRYNGQFFFGNDYWLGSWTLCHELQNPNTNNEIPPFPVYFFVVKFKVNMGITFTPQPRQIHLGLCLPKSCDIMDVRKLLLEERTNAINTTIIDVRTVPGSYSIFKDYTFQIVGTSGLMTLMLIIVASVVEVLLKKKVCHSHSKNDGETNRTVESSISKEKIISSPNSLKKEHRILLRLLLAFSAISNGRKIISANSSVSKDVIGCFHGLRVFSIGWIILVHTYLQIFGIGANKSLRTITEQNFMYQTIANATFSVDTFFFISGLLVTLVFLRNEVSKDENPQENSLVAVLSSSISKFALMIAYRFIRLTPAYLFVLGVNEVVVRHIHKGNKQLKCVAASISILLLSSWLATFILAIKHDFVAKVQEPFALFDELYDKPWMRIGPYLIGMIIGYVLFKLNGKLVFTPAVVILGWILSLMCLGSLVYGLGKHGLAVPASAFYAALGHTAWGLSLAWITVACCSGYGGPFNVLFSFKLFLPLSKLTYGAYLVHPTIMFLTSFALDGSLQIHNVLMVVIFFGNAVLSFICAFVISLAFEAPAINLMKIVMG
uniref:Nose resistant-to-fluoxetine protein N-terminal domain-containing protein n=1 Tax=Dendroctonus ponderosae TaxID=77166 RepID=A0AAR5PNC0_DENPD